MTKLTRIVGYTWWVLNGYVGRRLSVDTTHKATVLITYYNPERMKHIEPQVRNLLKCDFVEQIVLSNHNPEVQLEDKVKLRDARLRFINQPVRRGCGYRWFVADTLDPDYLIVIDDDIWLFPGQLAKLFRQLVNEPEMPHGLTGMRRLSNGALEYRERDNLTVDYLCEIYAVTRHHLKRYIKLERSLAKDDAIARMVAAAHDFMVISQTGSHNPKIHNTGRLFRSPTFNQPGVAVHKEPGFDQSMTDVSRALQQVLVSG